MSIDTVDELVAAWTADMRDESKDETARERWLRAQLAAERKRREGLEDELHLERLAHTAAVTRAEQAERERDAEREAVGLSAEDRDSAIQRAERAEADNAALVDGLRTAHDPHAFNTCHGTDCACGVVALLDAHHPGAAMLERMREMENILRRAVDDPGCMDEHWLADVVSVLEKTP